MCVVGYDDARYGGAFEVQNSWGTKWGNAGYIWIPYTVFTDFVFEAYGISENLGLYQNTVEFSGSAQIEVRGRYEPDKLAFTAVSANPNAVFGLLLAIQHR
jgi:hypothetical protein